jgi:hypothetical protein
MIKIKEKLKELQPYITGIRYYENIEVVDTVFKSTWKVPENALIKSIKSDTDSNSYSFFSENQDIGFDEVILYITEIIRVNVESEKKNELFKVKISELRELFITKTLNELLQLKFTIPDNNLESQINLDNDVTPDLIVDDTVHVVVNETINKLDRTSNVKKNKIHNTNLGDIELPPKNVDQENCNCGEHQACIKCIDKKDI